MLAALAYKRIWVNLGIIAFTALLLMPYLGFVHLLDSGETKYAESAREMLLTGDYLTVQSNFEPIPEEPPLFVWMQVLSMKVFGINEFAARFPNIICGFASLILLYYLGRQLYGHRFGFLWILSYGSAILPLFFFKSGINDPWFNFFILVGVAWYIFYLDPERWKSRMRNLALSSLFFGLAVLTKGPMALLIFLLCFGVYMAVNRFKPSFRLPHLLLFLLGVILVGGSWFLILILSGNSGVVSDYFAYQIQWLFAGSSYHDGFFGYHLVVLLFGVFPASVIALKSFTKKAEDTELQRLFRQWMYIMFWVVIVIFTIVRTKLLQFSSLAYFPLTFLSAWVWEKWLDRKIEIGNWQVVFIYLVALVLSGAAILFPLITDHYEWLISKDFGFIDPFLRGALRRNVHWSGYEWIIGTFLFVGVLLAGVQILRRNQRGMLYLHLVVLLFTILSIYTFTPRVEGYFQRATIKFYKELKGQDVYVQHLGFKSYAHLFYFDKQPPEEADDVESIMSRVLDKDAYVVIRIDKKETYLERYPDLEVMHEKDGFVFTVKRAGKGADRAP